MSASRMFPVTDFFEIKKGKRLTKANMVSGDIPFVGSSATNNGITAYIGNDTHLHEPGTITVSYNGSVGEVFLQDERFWASDDVNVWYPKQKMTIEVKLYFMAAIKKLSAKYSYTNKWTIDKMRSELVELPVDGDGKPNFNCMQERIAELEQERIAELEQERIAELDAYLVASGLDDYELTDEDKEILSLFPESASDEAGTSEADCKDGQIAFKAFKVGDVFNKLEAKCKKADFDKRRDTSTVPNEEYCVPLVNAKVGDNGIMFYGRKSDWNTQEMCIDVIQNGAVATGTVYAQPQPVGVLWDAYLIKPVAEVKTTEALLYMAKCIEKITKEQFSYDKKATWDRVKLCEVSLPVTSDGNINFDYMERYIRAIEKLAIADVAKYKDKLIATTRRVVGA